MAIEQVRRNLRARQIGDRGVIADVIPVAVRRDDQLERPSALGEGRGQPIDAWRGRVDRDGLTRRLVAEDVEVGRDRPDDAL